MCGVLLCTSCNKMCSVCSCMQVCKMQCAVTVRCVRVQCVAVCKMHCPVCKCVVHLKDAVWSRIQMASHCNLELKPAPGQDITLGRIKVFFHLKMYRIPQRKSVTKLQKLIKKNLKLNFAIWDLHCWLHFSRVSGQIPKQSWRKKVILPLRTKFWWGQFE